MIKLFIIIVSIVISIIIFIGMIVLRKSVRNPDPNYIFRLIKAKAAKGDVALSFIRNNEYIANLNEDILLPLASVVKTIVAIEYARQAAAGDIDPQSVVSFEELDVFYIPNTDGGARDAWMASLREKGAADRTTLSEVANGMITYSSNANTDYLIHLLGLDNINRTIKMLKLENHEPIYPIVSAICIPAQLMEEKKLSKKELPQALREMDMSEYRQRAIDIHSAWIVQPPTEEEKKRMLSLLSLDVQRVWSDRLPRSTTKDYVSIMAKLNSKSFFDEQTHAFLDPVMEQLMTNPKNREWLVRAGQKGGSTAFVLTLAMYATDREQNRTELAFFSNNLSIMEQIKLTRSINDFQLSLLTDETYRERLKQVAQQIKNTL